MKVLAKTQCNMEHPHSVCQMLTQSRLLASIGRTTHAHRTYWELLREHGCEQDDETASTRCALQKPMLVHDDPYPANVSRPWGTLVTEPLSR